MKFAHHSSNTASKSKDRFVSSCEALQLKPIPAEFNQILDFLEIKNTH